MADLTPSDNGAALTQPVKPKRPEPATVTELARVKRLPEAFLHGEGLRDLTGGGIGIEYFDETGKPLFIRERGRPNGKRFWQPPGTKLAPYGLWRLGDRGQDVTLVVTEGESDALTLWHHRVPALGLPGAESVRCLTAEHLVGVERLYIAADNDSAGERMVESLSKHLGNIGFAGRVYVISLPPNIKDVSDLYAGDTAGFPSRWRQLVEEARPLLIQRPLERNGVMGHEGQANVGTDRASDSPQSGWKFQPIDSAEFAAADYRPAWLIKRLLVAGQPAIVGGPIKCLKTSIVIDLALSLASGEPFLGTFEVYRRRRVAVLSGESGNHTVQEIARRVCAAKGIALADQPVWWQFDLPQLANPLHRAELYDGIRKGGVEVIILDPLYLALLSGTHHVEASNVFQMGPHLLAVAEACLKAGATPILTHHVNRPAMRKLDEPLDLTDLAYAGCSEFARQWIMVNRREPFAPGEAHRLRLLAGGSCGQAGLWAVDISEGDLGDDFTGRIWDVTVRPANEAEKERQEAREREKAHKRQGGLRQEEERFLRALDTLAPGGEAVSLNSVRNQAVPQFSGAKAKQVLARLVHGKVVKEMQIEAKAGSGSKRVCLGVQRIRAEVL